MTHTCIFLRIPFSCQLLAENCHSAYPHLLESIVIFLKQIQLLENNVRHNETYNLFLPLLKLSDLVKNIE